MNQSKIIIKYHKIRKYSSCYGTMSATSVKNTVDEAVFDLMCKFGHNNMSMLVYFASSRYDANELKSKMKLAFSESTIFGCSAGGKIVNGKMLSGSIVAMAFDVQTLQKIKWD